VDCCEIAVLRLGTPNERVKLHGLPSINAYSIVPGHEEDNRENTASFDFPDR
jgi:hypothetical protein